MLVKSLVGACLFFAGMAFYKHRQLIKFTAAAEVQGVLSKIKMQLKAKL